MTPAGPAGAGFELAWPGYQFHFPADSGAHPGYRIEWWYYTGHLNAGSQPYGFELTFFRVGLEPHPRPRASRWAASAFYLAHFALADPQAQQFHFEERADRGALGLAGAQPGQEHVWLANWSARVVSHGHGDPARWTHEIQASSNSGALHLVLTPQKPPVIQGRNGLSIKGEGPGQASHYYSYTRLAARGMLTVRGRRLKVTGLAWMDHEFSSSQLSSNETGWDWFSVQLDDGWELMLYQLRLHSTGGPSQGISPYSSGSLVAPDGSSRILTRPEFRIRETGRWTSPHSHVTYPASWEIQVPSAGLHLQERPMLPDQELGAAGSGSVVYWEGAVKVQGTHAGHPVHGVGYTELTGYSKELTELR